MSCSCSSLGPGAGGASSLRVSPASCATAGPPARCPFPPPPRCTGPAGPGSGSGPEAGGGHGAAGPPLTRPWPSLCAGHGEPRRQLAAAPGDGGLPLVEEVRRLRGEDRRPLPALRHGQLLAQPLPQVLLLPGPAGGHRHLLLHQERHDPLQERLHQVRRGGAQMPASTAMVGLAGTAFTSPAFLAPPSCFAHYFPRWAGLPAGRRGGLAWNNSFLRRGETCGCGC